MKIFNDLKLENQINSLDMGIVAAGLTAEYTYYVLNDSKASLQDIKFEVSHKEVNILEAPKSLKAEHAGKLVLAWSPSVTLKEGLRTILKVKATELWS